MPFHFLDSNHGMNIVPLNYDWPEFYDLVADVTRHALGRRGVWRRFRSNKIFAVRMLNFFRGITTGRPRYQAEMARRVRQDPLFLDFLNGESDAIPPFFEAKIREDLGPLWDALPPGSLSYDPNAYSASRMATAA